MDSPFADIDRWLNTQSAFAKALRKVMRGEKVSADELPEGNPVFRCRRCRDTGFELVKGLDGTLASRRCDACRKTMDAEIRAKATHAEIDVPEDEAPPVRDWKQAAGFDNEED